MIFVSTFLNGLTIAGYLFLMALGLNLSFGLMNIVNMSHGTMYLAGGFVGWTVLSKTGSWFLGLLAAGIAMGTFAFLEDFFFLRRARGNMTMETLITLSVSIIGADLIVGIWSGRTRQVKIPKILQGAFPVGEFYFPKYNLFIILFAVLFGVLFWFVLKKTKIGMIIRAGVDNYEIVSTLGINIKLLFSCIFTLSGVLAGFAGMIGGTFQNLVSGQDSAVMVYTLLIVIIGGMGSFEGAIMGSLIIGMAFTFGSLMAPQFSQFFLFAPVAIVLVFSPHGIFGKGR
ncbi:MAG: branched-chain amino acid ABC transporter permease [Clostridium sp.]|nr:branched-chain amino acid ABC transporter permease [Clostridium sp.]